MRRVMTAPEPPPNPTSSATTRVLSIDPGSKRVGLAISDETKQFAFPLETLSFRDLGDLLDQIEDRVQTKQVSCVVVGHPIDMSGTRGLAALRAERLAAQLERRLAARTPTVAVRLWDERLSTSEATRALKQAGLRGRALRDQIDASSAAVVLRSFLAANTDLSRARRDKT